MIARALVLLSGIILLLNTTFAAHIATETREDSVLTKRTDTYANSSGDLRIEERGYGSTVSSAAEGGGSTPNIEYVLGDVQDTMLFQINGEAIVSLEGDTCRKMTADSAPPPGLGGPGMSLGGNQRQMADAMAQANSAIADAMAQARQQGMSDDQARALEQLTKGLGNSGMVKPRDSLDIESLNKRMQIGSYTADGYRVIDQDRVEKHRVWLVDTDKIDGGEDVRNAMEGMMKTYEAYLDSMGGGALMDTGLAAMFQKDEFSGKYPVRIEDMHSGEITDVVAADHDGPAVDYYPDCVEKDMFGM